jgi:hypothetical protein
MGFISNKQAKGNNNPPTNLMGCDQDPGLAIVNVLQNMPNIKI